MSWIYIYIYIYIYLKIFVKEIPNIIKYTFWYITLNANETILIFYHFFSSILIIFYVKQSIMFKLFMTFGLATKSSSGNYDSI